MLSVRAVRRPWLLLAALSVSSCAQQGTEPRVLPQQALQDPSATPAEAPEPVEPRGTTRPLPAKRADMLRDRVAAPVVDAEGPDLCGSEGWLRAQYVALKVGGTRVGVAVAVRGSLALSTTPAAPHQISLSFPIVGDFELESDAEAFEIRSQQDIVPGHVWLRSGTPISATSVRRGTVLARKVFPKGYTRVSPDSFAGELPCSELTFLSDDEWRRGTPRWTTTKATSLRGGPKGVAVAQLSEGAPFESLDGDGEWVKVRDQGELVVEGWLARNTLKPHVAQQALVERFDPVAPNAQLRKSIDFRVAPEPEAKVFGRIAEAARVLVGPTNDGVVQVQVEGLVAASYARPTIFFVDEQELLHALGN